jgi:uncharacterized membrane protein
MGAMVALVLSALVDFTYISGYLSGAPIPAGILAIQVALGVAALAAAIGLWGRQQWATPLALVLGVLTLLLGGLALVSAESLAGKVIAAVSMLLGVVVILLVASFAARRASA